MKQVQIITATKARNSFFELLKSSYLQGKTYLIEKDGLPIVYLVPVGAERDFVSQDSGHDALWQRLRQWRSDMKRTSNSVELLREIRDHETK